MRKNEFIVFGMVILSFILSISLYSSMPERMASPWNADGDVSEYRSTFWGVFLIPLFSLGVFFLFRSLPKIDELRENIDTFRKYFDGFGIAVVALLLYVHILSLSWNLGMYFSNARMSAPIFAVFVYSFGKLLGKTKVNGFIGIRTPWTLSSEAVWYQTHQLGETLFKAAGLITVLGFFIKTYTTLFIIAPSIVVSVFLVVYSYMLYCDEKEVNA